MNLTKQLLVGWTEGLPNATDETTPEWKCRYANDFIQTFFEHLLFQHFRVFHLRLFENDFALQTLERIEIQYFFRLWSVLNSCARFHFNNV